MGLNAYLEAAAAYGYKFNDSTAANTYTFITGKSGKRIAVLSYAVTTGSVATSIYFMNPVPGSGTNSLASALTTASTAIQWSSTRPSNISTGDYVSIYLDSGTYIFATLTGTATTSTVTLSAGSMAAAAIGNPVYYFATAGNTGHFRRVCGTAATQYTDNDANVGRWFGSVLGGPMLACIPALSTATGLAGSWDYITVGFINV